MVFNTFIECNRCKTKFRLRWQVGYEKAAIQIRCPKCNSRLYGYLTSSSGSVVNIHGATEIKNSKVDFVQEISTEFLTHKLTSETEFIDFITPFIRNRSNIISHSKVMEYLHFIDEFPNEVEVINDLLNGKSTRYLKQKLRNDKNIYIGACKSQITNYRLNTEVDLLMASHQYLMLMFLGSGVNKNIVKLMKIIADLRIKKSEQVKEFSKLMDVNGYYTDLNNKFSMLANLYNENYLSLASTLIAGDLCEIDLNEYGLSSVDYEDLLELYRKCYEFIGEFIIYIVGLNNISERGDFNEFKKGSCPIEERVNQEDKYNRIQSFVKKDEPFSRGFCEVLNKVIRNAEAHFDVKYDIFTQQLTFISKGKRTTETEQLYLLEFANEVIKIFCLCVELWEIAYQLQKTRLIIDLKRDWNYGRS